MTDQAWLALSPWEQISETYKDGDVVFCLGLGVTWYFRDGHTDEKRRAALDCMNDYLALCGPSLRYWVVEGKSLSPVAKLKSRDMSPYLLSPKWNTPEAEDEAWAFLWHGGQRKEDASPFRIEALGGPKRDSDLGDDLSHLQVSFPVTFFADRPGELRELLVRWSARLHPAHGYGGITIVRSPNDGLAQMYEPQMAGLAMRHPGLEIDDPMGHAYATGEGASIKGGNWITVLSTEFLEKLGGLSRLREELGAPYELLEYPGGAVIVAGPVPEVGDWNRGVDTPHLRKLARVLKPIRVRNHPPIHVKGKFSTEDGFEEWLSRFDGDRPAGA